MRRAVASLVALASVVALGLAGPQGAAVADTAAAAAEAGPKVVRFVPRASDDKRLRASWKRWTEARGTTYVTRVTRHCLGCGPKPALVRTEVRRQRLVSVRNDNNDKVLGWGRAWPMDRLYRLLRRGYRNADDVAVRYDRRGVPISVAIDWDELAADEETYLTVRARTSG